MKKRFIQFGLELREVPWNWFPDPQADYHVMPDIKPYRSMIDGSVIPSRSRHREHLRGHRCIEIGNETRALMAKVKPLESPPGLHDQLVAVANEKLRRR